MSEIKLTKEADALICIIYKEYLQRRKSGVPKRSARYFGGSEYIHSELTPKWSFDDVDETCRELSRAGVLSCYFADNITCESALTDAGIIYMENRFKDGIASVLGYLERIRSVLPW